MTTTDVWSVATAVLLRGRVYQRHLLLNLAYWVFVRDACTTH